MLLEVVEGLLQYLVKTFKTCTDINFFDMRKRNKKGQKALAQDSEKYE